jgi:hypothetical protein
MCTRPSPTPRALSPSTTPVCSQAAAGCPTAHGTATPGGGSAKAGVPGVRKVPTGQARVRLLYEQYIHLDWLKQVGVGSRQTWQWWCGKVLHGLTAARRLRAASACGAGASVHRTHAEPLTAYCHTLTPCVVMWCVVCTGQHPPCPHIPGLLPPGVGPPGDRQAAAGAMLRRCLPLHRALLPAAGGVPEGHAQVGGGQGSAAGAAQAVEAMHCSPHHAVWLGSIRHAVKAV